MTITLGTLKEKQDELAAMIATFETQAVTRYRVPGVKIELNHGERYAGLILDVEGKPAYHLILLPGERESINWKDARQWAEDQGGDLPTRREQPLLFANLKDQFKPKAYWSCDLHKDDSGYAWYQYFNFRRPELQQRQR